MPDIAVCIKWAFGLGWGIQKSREVFSGITLCSVREVTDTHGGWLSLI